jgi:hypothetical protein
MARRRSATELGVCEMVMLPSGVGGRGTVELGFHSPGLRHASVTAITEVDAAPSQLPNPTPPAASLSRNAGQGPAAVLN